MEPGTQYAIWSQEPDLVQEPDLDQEPALAQEPDLAQVPGLSHEPDLGQEPQDPVQMIRIRIMGWIRIRTR
jgi:hypothetical protein